MCWSRRRSWRRSCGTPTGPGSRWVARRTATRRSRWPSGSPATRWWSPAPCTAPCCSGSCWPGCGRCGSLRRSTRSPGCPAGCRSTRSGRHWPRTRTRARSSRSSPGTPARAPTSRASRPPRTTRASRWWWTRRGPRTSASIRCCPRTRSPPAPTRWSPVRTSRLPAFTQGALALATTQRLDRDRLQRGFDATHTTSPAGPILASIDAARRLLATDGERLLGLAIDAVAARAAAAGRGRRARGPGRAPGRGGPAAAGRGAGRHRRGRLRRRGRPAARGLRPRDGRPGHPGRDRDDGRRRHHRRAAGRRDRRVRTCTPHPTAGGAAGRVAGHRPARGRDAAARGVLLGARDRPGVGRRRTRRRRAGGAVPAGDPGHRPRRGRRRRAWSTRCARQPPRASGWPTPRTPPWPPSRSSPAPDPDRETYGGVRELCCGISPQV